MGAVLVMKVIGYSCAPSRSLWAVFKPWTYRIIMNSAFSLAMTFDHIGNFLPIPWDL